MLLRKHIGGGRITAVSSRPLERIIHLDIEHLDEMGDLCRKKLIIEIMGKHSNIIFCDLNGRIIDSIKHVSAQMSSVREVLPGRDYFIPDTMSKKNPMTATQEEFISAILAKPMPVSKAIYSSMTGISPVIAEEICYLAGVDSSMTAHDLSEDVLTHLYRQFTYYMEDVRQEISILLFIIMEMHQRNSAPFRSHILTNIQKRVLFHLGSPLYVLFHT